MINNREAAGETPKTLGQALGVSGLLVAVFAKLPPLLPSSVCEDPTPPPKQCLQRSHSSSRATCVKLPPFFLGTLYEAPTSPPEPCLRSSHSSSSAMFAKLLLFLKMLRHLCGWHSTHFVILIMLCSVNQRSHTRITRQDK